MNKTECKRYIKKAYMQLLSKRKDINIENIKLEMLKVMHSELNEYIAYMKIGMHNLQRSANDISVYDLMAQIDVIPEIYSKEDLIFKADKL